MEASASQGKFKVCRKMNSKFSLSIKPVITPDNEYMIVAKDSKLLIYNIKTGYCVSKCRVDFSIKQKTGNIKGFNVMLDTKGKSSTSAAVEGHKIVAAYKRGYIVIWDIKNILEPGIENFYSFGHDIDEIIINQTSRHAFMICFDSEVSIHPLILGQSPS